jgi:hypothetical protein
LKGLPFKKSAKFLTLLLTSMLIASVSAAVFYSLSMTSTITTATANVWFVKGVDNATAGVNLSPDNTTATLTDLKAYPNASFTYVDPIRVRNNDTGTSYNIRLSPVSLSGNDTEFVFVKFMLRNGTSDDNATLATLWYNCSGSDWTIPSATSWVSITASTEWAITVETRAVDSASTGASVDIEITVDVQ